MTDFEFWSSKVDYVIFEGGVGEDDSISDLVYAIRTTDDLTKFEKEALIHKLWEAF